MRSKQFLIEKCLHSSYIYYLFLSNIFERVDLSERLRLENWIKIEEILKNECSLVNMKLRERNKKKVDSHEKVLHLSGVK